MVRISERCLAAAWAMAAAVVVSAGAASAWAQAARAPAKDADATVILDERAYIRQFRVFGLERLSAGPLKGPVAKTPAEGRPDRGKLARLKRTTKKLLAGRGIDWSKTDWRDVAVYHWSRTQCGVDERGAMMLPAIWPAANWASPDFDDSDWLCHRFGRLTPRRLGTAAYDMNSLMYRGNYYRACFEVPDPAKATDLTVAIRYRGGARILINGHEIARGHLPKGKLDEQAHADDYPLQAYVAMDDEIRPDLSNNEKHSCAQGIADLRTDWAEARLVRRIRQTEYRANCMNQALNAKGWGRIQGLRDRSLGPVAIPATFLRKGVNVLAVETRTSFFHPWIVPIPKARRWGAHGGYTNLSWDHCGLVRIAVRSASSAVPSVVGRPPAGRMRVWVADMHSRLWTPDDKPLGTGKDVLRFVGARNGTYSAQIGIAGGADLTGLTATAGELTSAAGAKIPASALRVMAMKGQPIWTLNYLGQDRSENLGYRAADPRMHASTGILALHRYRVLEHLPRQRDGRIAPETLAKAYDAFKFFDHITTVWPKKVPAGSCQPLWVYLKVPAAAAEGVYTGTVTVRADGVAPVTLPVRAEVIAWRLPDPVRFQTAVQSEQSPYGVARHYKVRLWSDEHFRLMGSSFDQLARLGVRWAYVSVLARSELGNGDDAMIRWIRRKDGSLAFDYAIMDRYLAMARKRLGALDVVCFLVMHGTFAESVAVPVLDEATGRTELVEVGPNQGATRRPLWRAFASSLYEHMKSLGLAEAMHWGQAFDDVPDKPLVAMLAEVTPGVYWTCAGHGRGPDATFRVASRAYGVDLGNSSLRGWKCPYTHLLMPRMAGSVICVEGTGTPFTHRVLVDRAIYTGFNGIGRMGADYFGATWFSGFRGGQWNMVGRSCVQTLWPGPDGAEASARHEAMLEGVQESDARIYLEQALERKVLPKGLADEVQAVLDRHCHETLYIPGGAASAHLMDYTSDWQGRSRRLYGAAAKVARTCGIDVNRTGFGQALGKVSVPAGARSRVTLTLRNWSDKPRAWTAQSGAAWIAPAQAQGTVATRKELPIILNGKALTEGADVTGTLTVTDAATGAAYPITIAATVVKGVELKVRQTFEFVTGGGSGSEGPKLIRVALEPVLNAPVGGSDAKGYLLVNRTADAQPWRIASDSAWLTAAPASGTIAPNSSVRVTVTARPTDKTDAVHEPVLTLTAANGAVKEQYKFKTYVLAPYRRPVAPAGQAVYLNDLDAKRMKRHVHAGFTRGSRRARPWFIPEDPKPAFGLPHGKPKISPNTPFTMAKKTFGRGLWVAPNHETVYDVAGAGFAAFAAEVGFYDKIAGNRYANLGALANFEIHVDGRLRVQSGLMKYGDAPRLLVVTGLAGAKEVKLVTRRDDLVDDWYVTATWGDPRFIKGK